MSPHEILRNQVLWKESQQDSTVAEEREKTFLYITIGDSAYLLPVAEVLEVSEILPIRLYPEQVKGHLGVISLRGRVVPVVAMSKEGTENRWVPTDRLVIINAPQEENFAIIVNAVKKVALDEGDVKDRIVTFQEKPVRILSCEQILADLRSFK